MANPAPKPTNLPFWATLIAWAQSTFYAVGERVVAAGNIYTCTTAGTSAAVGAGPAGGGAGIADGTAVWNFVIAVSAAWVNGHAYAAGDIVTNGGNLYQCITAGVSIAAGGGPTGTAGVIQDGTCVWTFLSQVPAQLTAWTSRTGDSGATPGSPLFAQYLNQLIASRDPGIFGWLRWLADYENNAHTWALSQTFSSLSGLESIFGDGSDGNGTADGINPLAGCTRVGTVYTAGRDLCFNNLTFAAACTLNMNGFRLYVNGTLTMAQVGAQVISCNGANASGATGGLGGGGAGILSANTNCSGGNGGLAANPANLTLSNALGGAGGNGGAGGQGAGGTSAVSAIVPAYGSLHVPPTFFTGILLGTNGVLPVQGGAGGGGGNGAAGGAGPAGGGGGGGGGVLMVATRILNCPGTATFQANGGNGAQGTGIGAGGGGGGGGGYIVNVYHQVISVAGLGNQFVAGQGAGGGGAPGAAGAAGTGGGQLLVQV